VRRPGGLGLQYIEDLDAEVALVGQPMLASMERLSGRYRGTQVGLTGQDVGDQVRTTGSKKRKQSVGNAMACGPPITMRTQPADTASPRHTRAG
jgi:hypothetical protein